MADTREEARMAALAWVRELPLPCAQKYPAEVLMALADPERNWCCEPSLRWLAERVGQGRTTLMESLAALQRLGVVTEHVRRGRSSVYQVNVGVQVVAKPKAARPWLRVQRGTGVPRATNQAGIRTGTESAPVQDSHHTRAESAPPIPVRNPHTGGSESAHRAAGIRTPPVHPSGPHGVVLEDKKVDQREREQPRPHSLSQEQPLEGQPATATAKALPPERRLRARGPAADPFSVFAVTGGHYSVTKAQESKLRKALPILAQDTDVGFHGMWVEIQTWCKNNPGRITTRADAMDWVSNVWGPRFEDKARKRGVGMRQGTLLKNGTEG